MVNSSPPDPPKESTLSFFSGHSVVKYREYSMFGLPGSYTRNTILPPEEIKYMASFYWLLLPLFESPFFLQSRV